MKTIKYSKILIAGGAFAALLIGVPSALANLTTESADWSPYQASNPPYGVGNYASTSTPYAFDPSYYQSIGMRQQSDLMLSITNSIAQAQQAGIATASIVAQITVTRNNTAVARANASNSGAPAAMAP